ncbi:MAG: DHH family phosphoesterase [Syntrophobacteraceae bacterium]|nr:DHH family phosphoesterase [Syntrophobacteraceae bacterium]
MTTLFSLTISGYISHAMSQIEPSPPIYAHQGKTWQPQLEAFYSCFGSKDCVLIMIDPDPDAIGAALAVKRLLWHKVSSVSIGIIRQIKRLNNLTMARLLRLPLVLLKSGATIEADKFVLVDGQPSHNDFFSRFAFTAVIDHHPQNNRIDAAFCDIRPDYGATSTIMTQYLRAAGVQPSQTIATALLYGIKTDTRNFERHTLVEDIDAFRYLFEFADHNILGKIEISDLSLSDTKFFHKAFARKHVVKDRIFAYLDEVPSPDILVEVAEFLLKIHDINWSIVSGLYQGNLIICVRNDGHRKDAGRLVRQAFGAIGCAGGHEAMARAEISMNRLFEIIGDSSSTSIERFVRRRLSPFTKY